MPSPMSPVRFGHQIGRAALSALVLAACVGCAPQSQKGDAVAQKDINAVMDAHVDELMSIVGVTGVAIGELDDGTPCILVLVFEQTDELERKIPRELEGHPVRLLESGEIKPMDEE
ncbi:MAG TPA: hypothetical protein VGB22_00905 [candidate division Zixibacteria bacterium]